ncbi:hypothetical protein Zm00014a_025631 [Zea mays]|uniref:Uncharacterized protein n=1 Tax=Zea mays TaxID=4577 RepID=A0A317Y363_MAIZE|nr:hypothetical protein Zm00014a_025631 [Zea mays]
MNVVVGTTETVAARGHPRTPTTTKRESGLMPTNVSMWQNRSLGSRMSQGEGRASPCFKAQTEEEASKRAPSSTMILHVT